MAGPVLVFWVLLDHLSAGNGLLHLFDGNAPVRHLLAGMSREPVVSAGHLPLDLSQTQSYYTTSSGPASRPAMALAAATAGLARYTSALGWPMRPGKLRLLVLTQRSPSARTPM